MKNLKYLLPLFLLFTFVFISCEEEEDPVDEQQEPDDLADEEELEPERKKKNARPGCWCLLSQEFICTVTNIFKQAGFYISSLAT